MQCWAHLRLIWSYWDSSWSLKWWRPKSRCRWRFLLVLKFLTHPSSGQLNNWQSSWSAGGVTGMVTTWGTSDVCLDVFFSIPVDSCGSQDGRTIFTPVSLDGLPILLSSCFEILLPSPTRNAFHTIIPPSWVYWKLFSWLIPLILCVTVVCFFVFTSTTAARQPLTPPYKSMASFNCWAVITSWPILNAIQIFTILREEAPSAIAGFLAGPLSRSKWNVEMVSFCGGRTNGEPVEKKLRTRQHPKPATNLTHIWYRARIEPVPHSVGGECFQRFAIPVNRHAGDIWIITRLRGGG